jgi:hypothetical protein
MVRLTISPRSEENLYGLLVQKELALRKKNQGRLHGYGPKKKDEEKWAHFQETVDPFPAMSRADCCHDHSGARRSGGMATHELFHRLSRPALSWLNRQYRD